MAKVPTTWFDRVALWGPILALAVSTVAAFVPETIKGAAACAAPIVAFFTMAGILAANEASKRRDKEIADAKGVGPIMMGLMAAGI